MPVSSFLITQIWFPYLYIYIYIHIYTKTKDHFYSTYIILRKKKLKNKTTGKLFYSMMYHYQQSQQRDYLLFFFNCEIWHFLDSNTFGKGKQGWAKQNYNKKGKSW